ncbi:response regulator [Xylophilus sp. ASV27]|uniref:response regulator n=1 Tax=Xylophilus sp. ASV27 TaxID=2795129 RepID=UPI0018EACF9E
MELNILIVDDNREAAELFQELLAQQGHDVRCVYNARQALCEATEAPAQVYLLDLTLPDMHGTELARQLRPLSKGTPPLMIAVTGLTPEGGSREEMAVFDHFLQKPVDFERLERILNDAAAA